MKKTLAVLVMVIMAVGFEWSLPQGTKDAFQITFKNQFSFDVSFYVHGYFVCSAKANSSCKAPVKIGKGSFKLEARGGPLNKVMASETFDPLVPGEDIIWETGNVEFDPRPARAPAQAVASQAAKDPTISPQTAPEGADVSFMTSFSTLNYQGQTQNRAQMLSLAKIERQTFSTRATYALSGESGFRFGKDGTAVSYKVSPLTVSRNLSDDRLSSDKKGLGLWLTVINSTLNGLTHKHMASGAWEEPITLSLGDAFPETIQAQFRAQPLPKPDHKWVLITADSGLVSFRALEKKYQDSLIYGRYQGVLVYSPKEDAFLQAAAVFTLYQGEDKFRIEQVHLAADANGKQLNPVLDVGPYLNFEKEAPAITTQGDFPSWCVQATQVFDIMHLAIMTAAEGSTNWGPVNLLSWEFLSDSLSAAKDLFVQSEMLNKELGAWLKSLDFVFKALNKGPTSALLSLGTDLALDLVPYGMGLFAKSLWKSIVIVGDAVIDKMNYDSSKITALTEPAPQPVVPSEAPQPAKPAKPESTGSSIWSTIDDLLLPLAAVVGAGTYFLLKGSSSDDCTPLGTKTCQRIPGNPGIATVLLLVAVSCDCPSGTQLTANSQQETYNGITYNQCFCFSWSMNTTMRRIK